MDVNVKKEIFADGIGQIHFAGGMVRFDFVTLQPDGDGKSEPVPLCKRTYHHAAARLSERV